MGGTGERYRYITDIKAVSLLLIVFWHCTLFYEDNPFFPESSGIISPTLTALGYFFDLTLIAAYVFCSGFLFARSLEIHERGIPGSILERIKRLLVPYYLFGTFWLVPLYTLFDIRSFGRPEHAGLWEGFVHMLLGQFSDHLWFLWMLFWVALFFILLSPLLKKGFLPVIGILSVAAAFAVELWLKDFPYFKLSQISTYLPVFFLGILCFRTRDRIGGFGKGTISLLFLISSILVILYPVLKPEGFAFLLIARIAGSMQFFFLFLLLDGSRTWHKITDTKLYGNLRDFRMDLYLLNMPFNYLSYRLIAPYLGKHPWMCSVVVFLIAFLAICITVQLKTRLKKLFGKFFLRLRRDPS